MSLFCASDLAFSYPSTPDVLFSNVSFTIRPGDRIALVGPNGCGKTTLLRIISRELAPNQGYFIAKPGLRVTASAQEGQGLPEERALHYAMRANPALYELLEECQSLEDQLADEKQALRYADLLNLFGEQGGYTYQARAERILDGLDIRVDGLYKHLSGGERTRLELAKLLLNPGDLLLLDEPTNHLDSKALEWLEEYLREIQAAVLVISHDRAFLDHTAKRIFELRQGKLEIFELGYFAYREERVRRDGDAWDRYEESLREIAKAKQAYLERLQKANAVLTTPKGQGIREGKDFYRSKAAKVEKTAKILKNRPFKEGAAEKPGIAKNIGRLKFPEHFPPGECVLTLQDVSMSLGGKCLFEKLSFSIFRGERWGIIGPNGSGKTTLLRLIQGELQPDTGKIERGPRVKMGILSQTGKELDLTQSPYQACCAIHREPSWVTVILAALKVRGSLIHRPMGQLSPGERMKVAIALLLLSPVNLLILDEPTNHLDIETREAIEDTLNQYPGTILLVSHDRIFLESIVTQVLALEGETRSRRLQQSPPKQV